VPLVLALAPFERAAAQDFPSRPVRFVVPYAAGGSGDLLARLLGNKLASIWETGRDRQSAGRWGPDRDRVCGAFGARRLYALPRDRRPADHRRDPLQARALRLEAQFHAGLDAGNGLSGSDRGAIACGAKRPRAHRARAPETGL